ncbi:MFS transporter [Streptomyces sp. NPDC046977]|uniref:MFS transporter n=1 Tax=Streptomyces sp. NPDC046977 TaxID=3154703 RepID=UPI00340C3426
MRRSPGLGALAAVGLAAFLTSLDSTVVTVALPQLQRELHLSPSDLEWVAVAYPLAYAALLLMGGQTADRYGHRSTLLAGTALFTAASVLCALATGGPVLMTGRLVQGAAAALIFPAALAVVTHDLPAPLRTVGVSLLTAAVAAALATGPVISGVLTQHLGWPSLFAINIPLAGAAWWAMAATMPKEPQVTSHPAADGTARPVGDAPWDMALICLALAGYAFSLIEGHRQGLSPAVLAAAATATAALLYVTAHQVLTTTPLPAVALLRHRTFTGGILAQLLWGLGVNGVFFFTAPYLHNAAGLNPTATGLAFTPIAGSLLLATPLLPTAVSRYGARAVVVTGLLSLAAGMAYLACIAPTARLELLLPGFAVIGAGSALAIPLTTCALQCAPKAHSASAAGVFSAAREASGVLGIAVIGAVAASGGQLAADTDPHTSAQGYRTALIAAAVLVATSAPTAWWALTSAISPTARPRPLRKPRVGSAPAEPHDTDA